MKTILLTILLFSQCVFAQDGSSGSGFYIEPLIGYEVNSDAQDATINGNLSATKTVSASGTYGESTTGLGLALRAGNKHSNIFYFAELYYSKTKSSDMGLGTEYLVDYSSKKLNSSFNFGFDIPFIPTLWFGYIFSASNKIEAYDLEDNYKGSGFQVAYRSSGKIFFEIRYFKMTYKERNDLKLPGSYTIRSGEVNLNVDEKQLESSGVLFSISTKFSL